MVMIVWAAGQGPYRVVWALAGGRARAPS